MIELTIVELVIIIAASIFVGSVSNEVSSRLKKERKDE